MRSQGSGYKESTILAHVTSRMCADAPDHHAVVGILADTFVLAYPTKRYRSAWIGIAVHSVQSIFLAAIVLSIVI